jgi:hypothetical protein
MIHRDSGRREQLLGLACAAAGFFVYVLTLCPTVDFIDSGELATDIYTLGIAHPTGYPLFTNLGYILSHIPLGLRPIYQINLMAALYCSVGLFVFFRFLVFFLRRLAPQEKDEWMIYAPAVTGTLLLAFSETYWSQALAIEVYSLHSVFIALLLYFFAHGIALDMDEQRGPVPQDLKRVYWYGFAYILGLSFTNHLTTILLAPGCLYLFFAVNGFSARSWRRIARMAVPFLLGLSFYCYLPVRAGAHPFMNWGNPVTPEAFFWHFSGKVYRVWIFSSTESALKQFRYYIDSFPGEFGYVSLLLVPFGLWRLFRQSRKFLLFTVLLFLGCLLYSINYDIHDIDSYFLLSYVTVAVWSGAGVAAIFGLFGPLRTSPRWVGSALCGLLCLMPLAVNYPKVDESDNRIVEDYTSDMLASVGPDAVLLSYQWDYFVSAAYYLQLVEHARPDVWIVDKELMRRSWYYAQLRSRYPALIQRSAGEVTAFLKELDKFEHDLPYNSQLIEYRYAALMESFVRQNLPSRPVYMTHEIEPQYLKGFRRVPSGLALRLSSDTASGEVQMPVFHPRIPRRSNSYKEGLTLQYFQAYASTMQYLSELGKKEEALRCRDQAVEFTDKILEIWPDFEQATRFREQVKSFR